MKTLAFVLFLFPSIALGAERDAISNPAIDMAGYLRVSADAAGHRQSRRLSVKEFLQMSAQPGTVVLDARSRDKFEELHIRGAINLPFPDIAVKTLAEFLPDKEIRILIYCNNNFLNNQRAFPEKIPSASLNLATYIALYNYGYRNVYELGPPVDVKTTTLPLVSSR